MHAVRQAAGSSGTARQRSTAVVITQGFIDVLDTAFCSGHAVTGTALPVLLERREGRAPEKRYVDLVYQRIRTTTMS